MPYYALKVTGPAVAISPPPSRFPVVAVPLLAVKVYRSSLTLVIEKPPEDSSIDSEKPSKG
jgi:hypothetical protein